MPKKLVVETVFKAIDKVITPIKKMSRGVSAFAKASKREIKTLNRVTDKAAGAIGKGLTAAFKGATIAAGGMALAVNKIVTTGAEFEKALVKAAVKYPGAIRPGTQAFTDLENAARATGATTEFTATQSAQALEYLALAGYTAEQSIAALPGVVNLATAAGVELQQASDMATDTLGAMDMAQSELTRAMDVMAKTTTRTNTNMSQLFEGIVKAGPTFSSAKQDITTLTAVLGTLANAGLKGETAGIAVAAGISRIQAPTAEGAALIRKYAGNILDAQGNLIDFIEIIRRLETSMAKMGSAKKQQVLKAIFGERPARSFIKLINGSTSAMEQLRKEFQNSEGASKSMADGIRNTTAGSIDSLKSAIEGVIISIFKLDNQGIKGVIDSATEWVRANEAVITSKIGEYIEYLVVNFDELVNTAQRVTQVIVALVGLIAVLKGVLGILTLINIVTAANPIVLIITGIIMGVALLAAAIAYYWEDISEFITYWWGKALEFVESTLMGLAKLWYDLVDKMAFYWTMLRFTVTNTIDMIVTWVEDKFTYVTNGIKTHWSNIGAFFVYLWEGIKSTFNSAIDSIMTFFQPLIDAIMWVIDNGAKAISAIGDFVFGETENEQTPDVRQSQRPMVPLQAQKTASVFERSESFKTDRTEVTLVDKTGRATVTKGKMGTAFKMQKSGAF